MKSPTRLVAAGIFITLSTQYLIASQIAFAQAAVAGLRNYEQVSSGYQVIAPPGG